MKKTSPIPVLLIMLSTFFFSACSQATPDQTQAQPVNDSPVEVYAVLAEKDDYSDVEMSNLLVDYIDIKRMQSGSGRTGLAV